MKTITDNDLILLYYGEHEDPNMASLVAASDELRARFESLTQDLDTIEQLNRVELDDETIAENIWNRLQPALPAIESVSLDQHRARRASSTEAGPRIRPILGWSLAAAAVLVLSVIISVAVVRLYPPEGNHSGDGMLLASQDQDLIFNRALQQHLQSTDVLLTRLVNEDVTTPAVLSNASGLLAQNRIYRQLASQRGNDRINALLTELEPLLLELANELQTDPSRDSRRQAEQDLLFKVRVMDKQLTTNQGESNAI